MTEKRFKQVVDGVKDTRTVRTLTYPLEFTLKLNEINELYDCVFDRNEELEKENEQLKASLYAEKTNTAEVVNDYSKQFKRHSAQFSFMMDLADDLGVDVATLEALDD